MATEPPINNVDSSLVNITIRLIMQGKEVGSIIGKKGDNIKKIRIESGAKINISDGTYAERIVTVTGPIRTILKAFSFIAQKFEEQNAQNNPGKSLVTLKLIVPASQCGSLIGKGGSKINHIRQITGASIQVASEMLQNSTERAVTLAGNAESITKCIYQICSVMIESPPKGPTVPYRPKQAIPPVIFAGGQAYTIQGQYAVHQPDLTKLHQLALQHAPLVAGHNVGSLNPQVASLVAANSLRSNAHVATVLAAAQPSTTNMSIPNEVIGCIIGKGGCKINEIRQLSGATIKITNPENGLKYRTISISGTSESINLAQYLIHSSMEMHKSLTIDQNNLAHQPIQTTSVTQITQATTSNNNNTSSTIVTTNNQQQQTTNGQDNGNCNLNNSTSSSNNEQTITNGTTPTNTQEQQQQNSTTENLTNSAMIVDNSNESISNEQTNNQTNNNLQSRPIKSTTATAELTGITKSLNGNLSGSHRPNTPNNKTNSKAVRKYAPY